MSDTKTVHQRIIAVMEDIGVVGKNQRADQSMGGYAYRGIDDIRNRLATVLPKHGLFIARHCIDEFTETTYKTSGGTTMRLAHVEATYRIYGADGDWVEEAGIGDAADTSDKASTQAMSTAYKYMVIELFNIATEEETDADATSEHLGEASHSNSPDRSSSSGGGPPACGDCGEPITGPCVKRDNTYFHKECPDG